MISDDVKKAFELGKKEEREETKKWILERIEFIENNSDVDEEGFRLLKKQISGEEA